MSKSKINLVFAGKKSGVMVLSDGKNVLLRQNFHERSRLTVEISEKIQKSAENPLTVRAADFCCFVRDVNSEYPVFLPGRGAALPGNDRRSYAETETAVLSTKRLSDFEKMNSEPEETYQNACRRNRENPFTPTWLSLGLDVRGFWLEVKNGRNNPSGMDLRRWGLVRPCMHTLASTVQKKEFQIGFDLGPGPHCRPEIVRRLEEGCLPILHSVQSEKNIEYFMTAFAAPEGHPAGRKTVRGTSADTAYAFCSYCENQLPEQERTQLINSLDRSEEIVLRIRVIMQNISEAPAYAFFNCAGAEFPDMEGAPQIGFSCGKSILTGEDGTESCAAITLLDGKAVSAFENSVLVMPDRPAVLDMIIPNSPISMDRADLLAETDFETCLASVRTYWKTILDRCAVIDLPEKTLSERFRAGILHLCLATTGESHGKLLANVGIRYSPIGSESAPIIGLYDSAGLTDEAERCLQFFFERLGKDGSLSTYYNYQNETGPFLWAVAEHYRLTGNDDWLFAHLKQIKLACNYLIKWRKSEKMERCRKEKCCGLAKGKVDDPDDFFHSFFLNAGSFGGLNRLSCILEKFDPPFAFQLKKECADYRLDILAALEEARSDSPATPLEDGTWIQTPSPWTEYRGDPAFHAMGGTWNYHGTIFYRTLINSVLACGYYGVIDPESDEMKELLLANQYPHTFDNSAFCQPYYLRHDYAHLVRGETKLFLKIFYNQLAAMQDRETYTMWEHYFSVPHKTHEEAWMLSNLLWMLFVEKNGIPHLCRGVPRAWLEPGNKIRVESLRTAFGKVSFLVESSDSSISCEFSIGRPVRETVVRLPHSRQWRPVSCEGGRSDPLSETVTVPGNRGRVVLHFL